MKVKGVCPHCEKAIHYSKKERAFKVFVSLLVSVFIALGILVLFYLFFVGPNVVLNGVVSTLRTREALRFHDDIRDGAIEVAGHCRGDDLCIGQAIFYELSDLRYVPDSLLKAEGFDPFRVLEVGDDCEDMAMLYVVYTRSMGVDSVVECSKEHCVASFSHPHNDYRVIVDLTAPIAYRAYPGEEWFDVNINDYTRWVWV